ncbi:hypothetical protein SAMN05444166_8497 [Singulisphaera sp. GP187]|nr:hypothetical protein SAMN05444166_8497 [Singulisphaera sp. GP187]
MMNQPPSHLVGAIAAPISFIRGVFPGSELMTMDRETLVPLGLPPSAVDYLSRVGLPPDNKSLVAIIGQTFRLLATPAQSQYAPHLASEERTRYLCLEINHY